MNVSLRRSKQLGLLTVLTFSAALSYGQLSGNYTVGTGGNYPDFTSSTGLFNAINGGGMDGDVNVTVISSITEPGTVGLNDYTGGGINNYHLNIRPAAAISSVISTATTDTLFKLFQVRNLKIDGSFNGGGRYLTFRNQSTGKNASAIAFIGNSTLDTIANCILEGANTANNPSNGSASLTTGSVGGVIVLNAFNISSNSHIAILGNIIKNISGTPCSVLLRALSNGGTSPNFNDNDSIYVSGNQFVNAAVTAIQLGTNNTRPGPWTITGNSFYNTETITHTSSKNLINLYQGLGHTVTDNIIGGSDSTGGGSPMAYATTASITFIATTGNYATSLIQSPVNISGNMIRNISITANGSTTVATGINGASKADISGNQIGGTGTANAITTSAYGFTGVNVSGVLNTVSNNIIRNIISTQIGTSTTNRNVCGISISGAQQTISNNTIDSIIGNTNSNAGVSAPSGIYVAIQSSPGQSSVSNNSITNVINIDNSALSGTGATVVGINIAGVTYPIKYSGNYIGNIYGFNTAGTYGNNIAGILEGATTLANGNDTFVNNVISLGNNVTAPSWVKGVHISSGTANANFVFRNNTIQIASGLVLNSTANNSGKSGATCLSRLNSNQNVYLYNNIFANNATNSGVGTMSALSLYGFTNPTQYFGDYNVFYAPLESGTVFTGTATNNSLSAWKAASLYDSSSTYASVPFLASSDLHINTSAAGAWNVFGRGIANAAVATDKDGNARNTAVGYPVTAGAYEIAMPASVPADMNMIPAIPVVGTPTEFWSNGRKIAEVNWVAGSTMPSTFSAKFYPGVAAPFLDYSPKTNAYFEISETGFSGSYTIKQYVNVAEGAGQPFSSLRAAKRHSTDPYTFIANAGSNSIDANGNYLLSTTQATFSIFGMTSGTTPLGICLKDIKAANVGAGNKITWVTVAEAKGDVFELQSSADGKLFNTINKTDARGIAGNYDYTDRDAAAGITYYRLKLIAPNSPVIYSNVVNAEVLRKNIIKVLPNPASDRITIKNNRKSGNSFVIELIDMTGRLIYSMKSNNVDTVIDVKGLPGGTYIIKVLDGADTFTTKVLKN